MFSVLVTWWSEDVRDFDVAKHEAITAGINLWSQLSFFTVTYRSCVAWCMLVAWEQGYVMKNLSSPEQAKVCSNHRASGVLVRFLHATLLLRWLFTPSLLHPHPRSLGFRCFLLPPFSCCSFPPPPLFFSLSLFLITCLPCPCFCRILFVACCFPFYTLLGAMPAGVLFLAALAACVPVTPLSVSADRGTRDGAVRHWTRGGWLHSLVSLPLVAFGSSSGNVNQNDEGHNNSIFCVLYSAWIYEWHLLQSQWPWPNFKVSQASER